MDKHTQTKKTDMIQHPSPQAESDIFTVNREVFIRMPPRKHKQNRQHVRFEGHISGPHQWYENKYGQVVCLVNVNLSSKCP